MSQGMIRRVAVLLFVALALSACGSLSNPTSFWRGSEYWNSADPSDRALASIERGDYATAKRHADEARQRDPNDPYALFVSALVYQNIGQPQMASYYYQSILSIQPIGTIAQGRQGTLTQRPIVDVARENLEALKRAHPGLAGTGALAAYTPAQERGGAAMPGKVGGIPYGSGASDWGIPLETNRLLTLKNIYDQGLITEGEFVVRRDASKSYALPYSSAIPPAAGLERTAPSAYDVSARLKAIAKALERGSIVAEQHADERNSILNGLLPPIPGPAGQRPLPPSSKEAEARRHLLNALLREGVIDQDEHTRETGAMAGATRMAVYQAPHASTSSSGKKTPVALLPAGRKGAVNPKASPSGTDLSVQPRLGTKAGQLSAVLPPLSRSTTPPTSDLPEFRQMTGCAMGVHLSSLSNEAATIQEWARLQKEYPQLLGSLGLSVARADLGGQGIFYQVKAGPLDVATAHQLCNALKVRGQSFCEIGNF